MSKDWVVVWNGGPLLPDRAERPDSRLAAMPNFDIDEGVANNAAVEASKVRRKYTRTGKYKGICSRTDPNAKQYKPLKKKGS